MYRLLIFVLSLSQAAPLADFAQKQLLLPPPPKVSSESFVIIDATTGTLIAEKAGNKPMPPGSLTKLMTCYVLFHAISQGHLQLSDTIHVSTNAWKTEGSRLFLNEHSDVPLETIIKGIIVASGNDASVAASEHFTGSESNFAIIMNRYAKKLNLKNTHFVNASGLPNAEQYTTALDLATISRHVVQDHPQFFHWFHEQSITYNNITQSNRHSLLKTNPEIDGLKTGYTDAGGFSLATTAQKENTRFVVVTLNAPSTKLRNQDTLALLNYGFRFYETSLLYPKNTVITSLPVYLGLLKNVDITIKDPFWATIPKGSREHLQIDLAIQEPLSAPLSKNQSVGTISAFVDGELVSQSFLYPAIDIQVSKGISYYISHIKYFIARWIW